MPSLKKLSENPLFYRNLGISAAALSVLLGVYSHIRLRRPSSPRSKCRDFATKRSFQTVPKFPRPRQVKQAGQVPSSAHGFTLIETIIAFGLLLAALVGPVSLITQGLISASAAKNKLIAAHLAQEGIELVRAIRDNNVLCEALDATSPVEWNSAPGGTGALDNAYELDALDLYSLQCPDAAQAIPQTPRPSLIACGVNPRPLLLNSAGMYTYVSGAPTTFSRCVHICSPPESGACGAFLGTEADADITEPSDQMEIISEVTWTERNAQKNFVLRERLYNWR